MHSISADSYIFGQQNNIIYKFHIENSIGIFKQPVGIGNILKNFILNYYGH